MQEMDVMALETFRHFGGVVKKSTRVLVKRKFLDYKEYICEATYKGEEGYVCYITYGTNKRNTREFIVRHMKKQRYLIEQPGKNLYNSIEEDIFGDDGKLIKQALSEEELKMIAKDSWMSNEQQESCKLNAVFKYIAFASLASYFVVGFNIINITIALVALYLAFAESMQFLILPYIENEDYAEFLQEISYDALIEIIDEEKEKGKIGEPII